MSVEGQDEQRERPATREALGLARSMILSGERMTPQAEAVFDKARAALVESEARERELEAERDRFRDAMATARATTSEGVREFFEQVVRDKGDELDQQTSLAGGLPIFQTLAAECQLRAQRTEAQRAVLVEARDKALNIAANTNGTDRGMHEALGEIETVLRAGVVEAEPDRKDADA